MSSVYPSLFSEGINHHFGIEYAAIPKKSDSLFHTERTKKRFWDVVNWETPGRPSKRRPGEGHNGLPFSQSFGMRATIVGYGALDSIPREDVDDDLYGVIHQLLPRMGGGFARSFSTNEEVVCAEYFANGFASGTGLATFDGVALFSTAHPTSLNNATVIANRPSTETDISIAAADACRTALVTQHAANGFEILDNAPRMFVSHPSQTRVARQVWKTPWERDTDARNQNIMTDYNVSLMEWGYFQKSGATGVNNAWFVVGQTHHLYKVVREDFVSDSDMDILTRSYIVTADHRFLVTHHDFRGTYASVGS